MAAVPTHDPNLIIPLGVLLQDMSSGIVDGGSGAQALSVVNRNEDVATHRSLTTDELMKKS